MSRLVLFLRKLMEKTLMIARDLRPRGSWGFYGFPRCFNYEKDEDKCSEETMKFNDQYGLFTYLEFNDYTCEREKERERSWRGCIIQSCIITLQYFRLSWLFRASNSLYPSYIYPPSSPPLLAVRSVYKGSWTKLWESILVFLQAVHECTHTVLTDTRTMTCSIHR